MADRSEQGFPCTLYGLQDKYKVKLLTHRYMRHLVHAHLVVVSNRHYKAVNGLEPVFLHG